MRFLKSFYSLQTRIALMGALVAFVAVAVVTAASLLLAKREMRAIVGDEQYATLTGAAAYIDADLDAKKALLRVIAEGVPEQATGDPDTVQAYIESHPTLREEFSNVVAFDPAGNLIANLGRRLNGESMNASERDYFRDTVKFKEGVISAPFKSRLSGLPLVLVTQPVTDQAGHLKFILGGSIDLSSPRVFGQLLPLNPGKTGYLSVITGDGTVLMHPDKHRILAQVTEEPGGATATTAAALKGFEGWTEGRNKAGVEALLTYRHLRSNNWVLISVYPTAEAFAPFSRARTKALPTALAVAVLAGVIGWLCTGRLLRPLGALQRHIAALSKNKGNSEVFNVSRQDEFGKLSRAFYALSKQREAAEAALTTEALTDPLTGLHNRRMFDGAIVQAFARAERSGATLALAYIDIDHFKLINDSCGHGVGDQVLVAFAERLRGAARASDTVVRMAGDEFVIIYESLQGPAEAAGLGAKIIDTMRAPVMVDGGPLLVCASVGIYAGSPRGATVADFIARADCALYRAKQEGRGRCAIDVQPVREAAVA
jgi:diguanylate cyclase (GGDEF)-like protein